MTVSSAFSRIKENLEVKKSANNSNDDYEIINLIENMLNNKRCFLEIPMNTAICILTFLNFNNNEIWEIYDCLSNVENFRGKFTFR